MFLSLRRIKINENRPPRRNLEKWKPYLSLSQKNLLRNVLLIVVVDKRQFDTLLASYESLAQTTLFTIRLELRCHVIYFLDQTIREGSFGLTEDEVEEEDLDPTIVELCKDLVSYEDLLSTTLESRESTSSPSPPYPHIHITDGVSFVLSGLAVLIDQTLLSLASTITLLTTPGLSKLRRIILTLSQNLKHLTSTPQDAILTRSLEYFSLFTLGPTEFIKWAKETGGRGYDYDEMKTMLGLLYSEQMGKARFSGGSGSLSGQSGREKSLGVRRAYNECLIELNEALWSQN